MRIAITSQNFRTITGHAGKSRRFLTYTVAPGMEVIETARIDLPIEMAMHGFDDRQTHPLDAMDIMITGGAGDGFIRRMSSRGVRVVTTAETDPETAVHAFLAGCLKAPANTAAAECDHGHHHDHAKEGD